MLVEPTEEGARSKKKGARLSRSMAGLSLRRLGYTSTAAAAVVSLVKIEGPSSRSICLFEG